MMSRVGELRRVDIIPDYGGGKTRTPKSKRGILAGTSSPARCLKGMRPGFRSSIGVLSLLVSSVLAADLPSFEAAPVKHSNPEAKTLGSNVCTGGPGTLDPGMLHCTNSSLSLYILLAYDVKWYKLVSPDWVIHGGSESGYDVTAKIPPGTSKGDYRLMLQHLLADRFRLVVHRETRELPVYSLVSGKGKPKRGKTCIGIGRDCPVSLDTHDKGP
jgi:hypothetical protein